MSMVDRAFSRVNNHFQSIFLISYFLSPFPMDNLAVAVTRAIGVIASGSDKDTWHP